MGSTVDKRIVEMSFDNKQFQSGVTTTLQALADLKKGLNLSDAVKGIGNISDSFKNFTLGKIAGDVDNLNSKFSLLGVAAFGVITNLANAAVDFGKKIFNAVTGMEAIKGGLGEYETQINAIQTILANTASKGTTMDEVTSSLDELNTYADKTIYNFTEMTKNIGTFTAAGVELDTSVAAIKGIANLAAVSGSTSQQAANGMYQLSQAISTGTVRLMDWNSVSNSGMGGEIFQQSLMETARVHGVAVDEMVADAGSFRGSLETNWLSSEILLETLAKFTGDLNEETLLSQGYTKDQAAEILKLGTMANDAATKIKTFTQLIGALKESAVSGWVQSWELLIGDFEEAKEMWTNVSDTLGGFIQASADARNEILQRWNDLGGREALIETISSGFNLLLKVLGPVKEAFREVFPPITGNQLYNLTIGLKNFIKGITVTGPALDRLKRIFKGVFAVIDIFRMAIVGLVKAFFGFLKPIGLVMPSFTEFLARIADFIVGIRDGIKSADKFGKFFTKMYGFLSMIIGAFALAGAAILGFGKSIIEFLGILRGKLVPVLAPLKPVFDSLRESFGGFASTIVEKFKSFKAPDLSGIKTFGDTVKQNILNIFDNMKPIDTTKLLSSLDKVKEYFTGVKGISTKTGEAFSAFEERLQGVKTTLSKIGEGAGEAFKWMGEKIKGAVSGISFQDILAAINTGLFASLALGFQGFFAAVQKALTTGLLAAVVLAITKFINTGSNVLSGVTGILDGVSDSLKTWQNSLKAQILFDIAKAIALIALSVLVLSLINADKLTAATTAITVLFVDLIAAFTAFSKLGGGGMAKSGTMIAALIGISAALLILSLALVVLSKLNWDEMATGLNGLIGISGILIVTSKLLSKNSGSFLKASIGLVSFAWGILAIAGVVRVLGGMDTTTMGIGLLVLGIIIGEFILFSRLAGNAGNAVGSAISMVILAGAIYVLAGAVAVLGNMDRGVLDQGLLAMSIGLSVLFAVLKFMPQDAPAKAAGILILSGALVVLAGALKIFGNMSIEEIGKAMLVLGYSMIALVGGLNLMKGTLAGSVALLIAAVALTILSGALLVFGQMSLEQIGLSLLMLAGVFLVFGLAGLIMAPLIPVLTGLAIAILLFGLAGLAFGAGVLSLATGLAIIIGLGAGALAMVSGIILLLIEMLPLIVDAVGRAIFQFLDIIIKGAPKIWEALKVILLGLIDTFIAVVPQLVTAVVVLIASLVAGLLSTVPLIIEAALVLITALLTSIRDHIGEITTLAIDIILEFARAMTEKMPEIVKVATDLVTEFIDEVALNLPDVIESAWNFIIEFIDGLTESIEENLPTLIDSVAELGTAIIEGLIKGLTGEGVTTLIETIKGVGTKMLQGIKEMLGIKSPSTEMESVTKEVVQGLINGLGEPLLSDLITAIKNIGTNLIKGIKEILGIESPSTKFEGVSKNIIQGLIDGLKIETLLSDLWTAIKNIAKDLIQKIKDELGVGEGQTVSQKFKDVAKFIIDGLLAGLGTDAVAKILSAVTGIGAKMIEGIKAFLKIESPSGEFEKIGIQTGAGLVKGLKTTWNMQSPSKELAKIGSMAIQGLANGLLNAIPLTIKAAKEVGEQTSAALDRAISNISGMLDANMELNPTIRPVIDLTEVLEGGKTIDEYFGRDKLLSLGVALDTSSRISADQNRVSEKDQAIVKNEPSAQAISFVQNNYSPEALSRLEIYRQTRNQLAIMKGLVTT